MKLRVLIADDEPLARNRVRDLLAEEGDVEILGEASNGAETIEQIQALKPDLVFLDVQMPRLNGFEVLEMLEPEQVPIIIFTTAHDQHAIRAFEVNALDYLLKPFTEARFSLALGRAREQLDPATRKARGNTYAGLL